MGLKARHDAPTLEATDHDGPNGAIEVTRLDTSTPGERRPPAPTKRVWGILGVAVAILLLVAGFARILMLMSARPVPAVATSTATALPSPTATPIPRVTPAVVGAQPLSWQAGTAPIPLTREIDPPVAALAPAPADGRVAYLCGAQWTSTSTDIQPQVWVTTDAAAHWTQITTLPLQRHYNACGMAADDTQPASAVVTMGYNGASSSYAADFATFDGGKTWSQVGPQDDGDAIALATAGNTIYELRSIPSLDGGNAHLFAAPRATFGDMRTWARADAGLPAHIHRFWLNPTTGALLVLADDASNQSALYQSLDSGKTWSTLRVPSAFNAVAVQRPTSVAPWHICISAPNPAGPLEDATCTADGAQSWTTYTWPADAHASANVGGGVGLASDGSLLVIGSADTGASGAPRYTLYRLMHGGTQWQSLGTIPELTVKYTAGPGAGMLWALPAVGIPIDPQQRPFTTTYPS